MILELVFYGLSHKVGFDESEICDAIIKIQRGATDRRLALENCLLKKVTEFSQDGGYFFVFMNIAATAAIAMIICMMIDSIS